MSHPYPSGPPAADPYGGLADPGLEPDDPRVGSRAATYALLALLTANGALLGAFGLLFTPLYRNGFPTPMGALLTILILPWLVRRAGELDPRPGAAIAPLLAWFVVLGVLAVGGPGGDVLIEQTWQTALLVLGGLAAGLWALRTVVMEEARDDG